MGVQGLDWVQGGETILVQHRRELLQDLLILFYSFGRFLEHDFRLRSYWVVIEVADFAGCFQGFEDFGYVVVTVGEEPRWCHKRGNELLVHITDLAAIAVLRSLVQW